MSSAVVSTLIVYAYSSFVSSWGVGPVLAKKFEAKCHCEVELVDAGNGGAMVARLKLEKNHLDADVVVGIDQNFLPRIKSELGWTQNFVAYETGPYAFIYNSTIVKNPPKSLDDLLLPEWKSQIIIEDPRLSTVGLGFLIWVIKEKGDGAWDYFKKLKPQLKIISPSWDLAYGMFKKNQAKLVLSYWTSPAYHIQEEHTHDFMAAAFDGGHYVQREYFTIVPKKGSPESKKLANDFANFLLSPEAQEEIPKKNFMYPINPEAKTSPAFEELGRVKTLQPLSERMIQENLDTWLKKWREIF